ncbi:YbaK/EbsC family protein [Uliginosibacterium paludis]|uniref:YbaK/EbsC family protein n=1 Tax=Uliginosibacterium paludis TaxID=1615952 RepID=A0ABV2CNK7_9RHOO
MKTTTHPDAIRIQRLLDAAGISATVVEFEQSTHSSAEAAAAVGCAVEEIAKTVVFRGRQSGAAAVVIASGANRICEKKLAALLGEKPGRADADFVLQATGYVVGGVAPLGHPAPLRLFLDADLQRFPRIWSAAGTPNAVFPLSPAQLAQLTAAPWADVRKD